MNGGIYKAAPYSPVEANSVPANREIPSGATVVNGAYFSWNENGFSGKSWFITPGSPLDSAGITEADIDNYLAQNNNNLNNVFAEWNPTFDGFMNWADNFREGGDGYGCADFDISVTD